MVERFAWGAERMMPEIDGPWVSIEELTRLQQLVDALKRVPLYSQEPDWGAEEDRGTIECCNACGFPKLFAHDGDDQCPVAVVERLLPLFSANQPSKE